ncbi:MAG: alanine--glyoxylate aminotransferase family protein [Thaumarchaeota archaeon]|nr:alanine--glyoxylate aminotransferase family protein [Nitrososphaerota archaeon]
MSAQKKLIMLPGPTNVSERVMRAMQKPIINHRGKDFASLLRGIQEKSKHIFQTEGEVVVLSSSGTGGMEAAVWNLIRPGDVAVVPVFGEFSQRLAETVELAGGTAVRVVSDFGSAPSFDDLEGAVMKQGKFKALYLVHNETSTGVALQYVQDAARIARDHGAFVVVDAISSLGGYSIPCDKWGVDVCVVGSQKCIAAPPGVALLSVSKRIEEFVKGSPPKTRYFDLARYLEYGTRGETPFTPALPIFYALDEALTELAEEGLATRVKRHLECAAALYDGVEKLGLKPVADSKIRSRTVVAVAYPEGTDDGEFRKKLDSDHGIVVAGGFGPFKGKVFRVGCMGLVTEDMVKRTLAAVSECI